MRILLSNDDGIHSPCLRALHDALCEAGHELDVVAPLTEQSGVGCSVTLHNPLRLYPVQEPGFSGTAVAGRPVDCVKLALTTLLPQPPGFGRRGHQQRREQGCGRLLQRDRWRGRPKPPCAGCPAVAFSRPRPELEPPQALARHAASLVDAVDWRCCARESPERQLSALPRRRDQGHPGRAHGREPLGRELRTPRGPRRRPYWWIADFLKRDSGGDDTDIALMEGNWVAVTPLQVDRTDRELLGRLQERFGV